MSNKTQITKKSTLSFITSCVLFVMGLVLIAHSNSSYNTSLSLEISNKELLDQMSALNNRAVGYILLLGALISSQNA